MKKLTLMEEIVVQSAIRGYIAEQEKRLPVLEAKRGTFEFPIDEERLDDAIDGCRKRIRCAKSVLEKVQP